MKRIPLIILLVAIAVLQFLYGSAISMFLTIIISAGIIYFLAQVSITKLITDRLQKDGTPTKEMLRGAQRTKRKVNTWLPIILMLSVFIASLCCLKSVLHPGGKHPYFTNNQYHALSNKAIAYNNSLSFQVPGAEEGESYNIQLKRSVENNALVLNNVYLPIYKKVDDDYRVANNIFPMPIPDAFEIKNGATTLSVIIEDEKLAWYEFYKNKASKKQKFTVSIYSNDSTYQDEIGEVKGKLSFEINPMKEGMTLYNLILDQEKDSVTGANTNKSLERVLQEIGDTYLLKSEEGDGRFYTLFPSKSFGDNGYKLFINGKEQLPKLKQTVNINDNQKFYINFHNRGNALYVQSSTDYNSITEKRMALVFENPSYYPLTNPTEDVVGNKSFRFITNNEDEVIETAYNEGYLFNNHGYQFSDKISGLINFSCGKPNTPLSYEVNDNTKPTKQINFKLNEFTLSSSKADFIFELKDFSKNGYSYPTLLLFACLLFLLFCALLIFFPGKKLSRIEPIIFAVIYGLYMLRFILSWRIATFPPLENISKFELENTLIGFDYKFMGIALPVPFSLLIIFGLAVALIIYRTKGNVFAKIKLLSFFKKYSLTKQHLFATLACVVIYMLNKATVKVEVVFRVTSIILPLILYLYYSLRLNKEYVIPESPKHTFGLGILNYCRDLIYYFYKNPTFIISLITLASFAVTDKGFAVLFALFLLLKNILLHFFKNTYDSKETSFWKMLSKPKNYWLYGALAFIAYLFVIGFKSAFYFALLYKVQLLFVLFLAIAFAYYLLNPKAGRKRFIAFIPSAILLLVLIITPFRQMTNNFLDKPVRHVKARASIIHQPISDLIEQNDYSSYQAQKVIASAESQWFINTFITKKHDRSKHINLQPHTKVGVNYSTQTRDVVLARYIIGEWGNFSMYLILLLFVLPLIIYLLSYKIKRDTGLFVAQSYGALIPFLLLLTLALFVWLTATNRFVFFGQDFPFLSITSRVSVLLPLLLFFAILLFEPEELRAKYLDVKGGVLRYALLLVPVAVVAIFTTLRNNDLESKNFNVVATETEQFIQKDFNGLLQYVQDSLDTKRKRYKYNDLVQAVKSSQYYAALKSDSVKNVYTKSLLAQWEKKPSMAQKLNSPLYITYDAVDGYEAIYNKNLYLHLPKTDNKHVWSGSVVEHSSNNNSKVKFQVDGLESIEKLPSNIDALNGGVRVLLCPSSWFVGRQTALGIVAITNEGDGATSLVLHKHKNRNVRQKANSYATTFEEKDGLVAYNEENTSQLSFKNSGQVFAENKWLNSNYRIIYPLKKQNFWVYHFANALRSVYKSDSLLAKDVAITLDHNLEKNVYQGIKIAYAAPKYKKNKRFKFSVIASDGDGNIRLMQDIVSNRKTIDPNDTRSIYNLQQKHFFFSNTRNERDQWGNTNLMTMSLGPGSSIKPLVLGVTASRVNAGWQDLIYYPEGGNKKSYAGFKLDKEWKTDEHYFGEQMNAVSYIEASSNFYHSLIMFLSSYEKEAFAKEGKYSLRNILQKNKKDKNVFPRLAMNGQAYRLPTYKGKKGPWPRTGNNNFSTTYFGNYNSILSNGLEWNANLRVSDKDKNDFSKSSYTHINFSDSLLYNLLAENSTSAYLWSYPEVSQFLQGERSNKFPEIHQNFNLGFKTPTLGGYPYKLSPYKMLEMYNSLCSQNRSYRLKMLPNQLEKHGWDIDSSWGGSTKFNEYLAANVFQGMKNVVDGGFGTANELRGMGGGKYFLYAKTGTINESGSGRYNSRRLVVIMANKDLTKAENIGRAKTYSFYFAIENNNDFNWDLLKLIMQEAMQSASFKKYFRENEGE